MSAGTLFEGTNNLQNIKYGFNNLRNHDAQRIQRWRIHSAINLNS